MVGMKHIGQHMSSMPKKKDRATERGELLLYFMQKLNMPRGRDGMPPLTIGRMAKTLEGIPTLDLYFLKSICDDAQRRGDIDSFSKKFWWEINPKNHTEEAVKKRKDEAAKGGFKKFTKKRNTDDYDA